MSEYFDHLERHLLNAVPRRATAAARRQRLSVARWLRPVWVVLALAAVATAGAFGALAVDLSTKSVPAAFAVVLHEDGSVTLTVRELIGVGPANARLAGLGVRARLVRREPGCRLKTHQTLLPPGTHPAHMPDAPRGTATRQAEMMQLQHRLQASVRFLQAMAQPASQHGELQLVIHPHAIPRGYTLVLSFRQVSGGRRVERSRKTATSHAVGGTLGLFQDPAPNCLPAM